MQFAGILKTEQATTHARKKILTNDSNKWPKNRFNIR